MVNHGPSEEAAPSAKQLVFMAMMATVVAVIVFLCGVLVGRGVPAGRTTETVATEATPRGAGTIDIDVPEIAPNLEGESSSPLDALSYFDRLSGSTLAPETLTAPASEAAEASALGPEAAGSVPGTPVNGVASAVVPVALSPGTITPDATAPFVVQVTALRSGNQARTVAAGLVVKGYPAFVLDPAPGAPGAVYRVRVGPYADHSEADTVRHRLEMEERFTPWVIQF